MPCRGQSISTALTRALLGRVQMQPAWRAATLPGRGKGDVFMPGTVRADKNRRKSLNADTSVCRRSPASSTFAVFWEFTHAFDRAVIPLYYFSSPCRRRRQAVAPVCSARSGWGVLNINEAQNAGTLLDLRFEAIDLEQLREGSGKLSDAAAHHDEIYTRIATSSRRSITPFHRNGPPH